MPGSKVHTVAVTGAAGFVGSALSTALAERCHVLALGRRFPKVEKGTRHTVSPGIEQRRCDLFSVSETEAALEGATVAVYLVHSMSPNARLTQGAFEDLDLLLADNFARAASRAGIERIIYLGGLLPPNPSEGISAHLKSRWEVEDALGSHGVPVTAVRAGLVVGSEGSSLNLLVRLVERLPLMICPSWTSSRTQPVALTDVIEILRYCCENESTKGRVCEIGGPDVMSYREMMQATARVLGRRRPMLPVPFVTPALSELWVSLVTRSPRSLVRPLIESLRHPMVVQDGWLQTEMGHVGLTFEQALSQSLRGSKIWKRSIARSVQRLPLPPGRNAAWVAHHYFDWLQQLAPWLIVVDKPDGEIALRVRGLSIPVIKLRLAPTSADLDRVVFRVTGGLLASKQPAGEPRLEFRPAPNGHSVLAALQDFEPRLPWWLYAATQAPLHRAVMAAYRISLGRSNQKNGSGAPSRPAEHSPNGES